MVRYFHLLFTVRWAKAWLISAPRPFFKRSPAKKICINRASLCDQRSVVSETHHLESIALLCNSINSGVTCYHMQMSESEQKKSAVRFVRVEPGYEGQRIDNFLLNVLKGVPKSYVYRIIRRGEVRVNKGRKPPGYRVQADDFVRIPPLRLIDREDVKPDGRLLRRLERAILYRDDRFLIMNKESGLAVHGGSGVEYGAIEALRALFPEERELELVHRLDRDTSGCLIISRQRSALRVLHQLLRNNRIDKRYLALVDGSWSEDRIKVEQPLLKNTLKSGERVVKIDPLGKPAITRFQVRQRFNDCMLVEAKLVTGRTHQIRVHAAHLGTPILGDEKYGNDDSNRRLRRLGLKRLFLHAESLRFRWPETSTDFMIKAPLDKELQALLERMSFNGSTVAV